MKKLLLALVVAAGAVCVAADTAQADDWYVSGTYSSGYPYYYSYAPAYNYWPTYSYRYYPRYSYYPYGYGYHHHYYPRYYRRSGIGLSFGIGF